METVIVADHLTRQFDNGYSVSDLSFEIPRGVIFGIIGPEGSGKTTTIRMLTGSCIPTGGDATVFGQSVYGLTGAIRQKIGYMPRVSALYPELTAWENMNFRAALYGMRPFQGKRIRELLKSVEILDQKRRLASQLSPNLQRRLSLAAALVHNPDLIFLDDPTAELDAAARSWFWEYFQRMRSAGRTLVVATRSVADLEHCDQAAVISEGRLLLAGQPEDLRRQSRGGEVVEPAALHV